MVGKSKTPRQSALSEEERRTLWTSQLLERMAEHVSSEKAVLEKYRGLARDTAEPDVRYLLSLIAEEEERHHALMAEIANAIRRDFRHEIFEPAVPELTETPLPLGLVGATLEMLAIEENDERELRRLASELVASPRQTMWPLLVEMLIADTEKHAAILRFILQRAEGAD
ncbi:MAG TPA: ferritin family protein [Acidimicrobiales bacterium]|nr:ferritin family protein [Acidimicrobiales bacterium]